MINVVLQSPKNAPEVGKGLIRDFRILWTMEELGLDYEIEWFDLAKREHKSDAYRKMNPFGRIPTAEIDGKAIFESAAIALTLTDKAGKLTFAQGTTERAELYKWAFTALATADALFFQLFAAHFLWPDAPGSAETREKQGEAAREFLAALESTLQDRTYLIGDEFSIADLLMSAVLRYTLLLDMLGDYPVLSEYLHRNYERPACKRALEIHLEAPDNCASAA